MVRVVWRKTKRSVWFVTGCLMTAAVILAIQGPFHGSTAQGEIEETKPPQAFLSGGARSEIVLREIAETLKKIDARLERFERALRETERDAPAERQSSARNEEENR
jgi:hypothetical protein